MFGKQEMYRVLTIKMGEVEQHMSTGYAMAVSTFHKIICNAILNNTPRDVVLQTPNGIAMSFHSGGVDQKKRKV